MSELCAYTTIAAGKDKRPVSVPAHQQVKGEFPPKYIYVIRDTSLPSAFQGSETWCEFSLPREMGVLENMRLVVDITAKDNNTTLMPTPYWCSRVEYYWGSDLVETTYADDMFHEVAGMVPKPYFENIADKMNLNQDYSLNRYPVPAGQSRWFVPLVSHLSSMKPFVRGFESIIKVRVYFSSSITFAGGVPFSSGSLAQPNPTNAPTLNEVQLFVCEAQMSRENTEKAERLHKNGVVHYSGIFRERQSDALSFNSSGTTAQYLRSFKHDSAGLVVYIQDQSLQSNASDVVLAPVHDITLQDAVGNKLTEQIRSDFSKTFVFTDHIDSNFTTHPRNEQPDGANLYLISFTSSFSDTLRTGNCFGKRALTSQERLIYTPVNVGKDLEAPSSADLAKPVRPRPEDDIGTPANAVVNVVSYSYGMIVCKGGKHHVHMVSTADEKNKSW